MQLEKYTIMRPRCQKKEKQVERNKCKKASRKIYKKKKKECSTWDSQVVPHPSTNHA